MRYSYFQTVIKESWTWAKLTEEEKRRFIDLIYVDSIFYSIARTDKEKIELLNFAYHAFLVGLGYKPIGWREVNKNEF